MKSRAGTTLDVLRKREEFLALAKNGRKWIAPGLILQAGNPRSGEMQPAIRYGLTASGKIGNAVKRNRARRRLRALAVEILPFHAALGRDYVLIARGTTGQRPFADLRQDLITAMQKLDVWKNK